MANLFLTAQGAKLPPATCEASTNTVVFEHLLTAPDILAKAAANAKALASPDAVAKLADLVEALAQGKRVGVGNASAPA